eukprot:10267917-Alexandrium_andersonii.AAC.1
MEPEDGGTEEEDDPDTAAEEGEAQAADAPPTPPGENADTAVATAPAVLDTRVVAATEAGANALAAPAAGAADRAEAPSKVEALTSAYHALLAS